MIHGTTPTINTITHRFNENQVVRNKETKEDFINFSKKKSAIQAAIFIKKAYAKIPCCTAR